MSKRHVDDHVDKENSHLAASAKKPKVSDSSSPRRPALAIVDKNVLNNTSDLIFISPKPPKSEIIVSKLAINDHSYTPKSPPDEELLSAQLRIPAATNFGPQLDQKEEREYLTKLKKLLSNVKKPVLDHRQDCVAEATLPHLPVLCMPHLPAQDFGHVPLPLNQLMAEQLIKHCENRPGTRVLDHEWHFTPDEFNVLNKNWYRRVNTFVERELVKMGLNSQVVPKVVELSLYRAGSSQRKLLEFKTDPNTVAILILRLPSVFTGGQLKLGETVVFEDLNPAWNPFQPAYAIYKKGLPVEKCPLTSGYELNLVYALTTAKSEFNAYDEYCAEITELLRVLAAGNSSFVLFDQKYLNEKNERDLLIKCIQALPVNCQFELFSAQAKKVKEHPETKKVEKRLHNLKRIGQADPLVDECDFSIELDQFNRFLLPIETNVLNTTADVEKSVYWNATGKFSWHFNERSPNLPLTMLVMWPRRKRFDHLLASDNLNLAIYSLEILRNTPDDPEHGNLGAHLGKLVHKLCTPPVILGVLIGGKKTPLNFNASRVLELLRKANQLAIINQCLQSAEFEKHDLNVNVLVNLIVTFGWPGLKSSMLRLFSIKETSDHNVKKLTSSCLIVKELVARGETKLAAEFYKDMLVPALDMQIEIKKLVKASYDNFFFSTRRYSELIQDKKSDASNLPLVQLMFNWLHCIVLCDEQACESMNKYNNMVIGRVLANDLKELAALIMLDFEALGLVEGVCELLRYRAGYLGDRTRVAPKFSWNMPNVFFFNHPEFDEFMRSDEPTMIYTGVLSGVKEAREFVQRFAGERDNYSTTMEISGSGRNTKVKITKTTHYYEKMLDEYNQEMEELKRINLLLETE